MVRAITALSAVLLVVCGMTTQVAAAPVALRISAPRRMVNDKSLTIRTDVLDAAGNIDWQTWAESATVTATRVDSGLPVPIITVIFDSHDGIPANGAMRIYNGVGSVSIQLALGILEPAGDIRIRVALGSLAAERTVTVLANPPTRVMSGTLSGSNLTWRASDGVIHVTQSCIVQAGRTLIIEPGTLIMVDAGSPDNGTFLHIDGNVQAIGTEDQPIFWFPTNPLALRLMATCLEPRSNPLAWRGLWHNLPGSSTYEHVFITGAGNGPLESHTRPAILRFYSSHHMTLRRCVIADNNGKAVFGFGSGNYHMADCLVTRCGHGAEFAGIGDYTLLVEDSWFTGLGHGAAACDYDGDLINVRGQSATPGGPKVIRRCIFSDSNDDGIDQQSLNMSIESCILYDVPDKAVSMQGGGQLTIDNTLIFDTRRWGINAAGATVRATYTTFNCPLPIHNPTCNGSLVENCILWPSTYSSCCGTVRNSILGSGSNLSCGTVVQSTNPQFVNPWPAGHDYRPGDGSPAWTMSTTGGQIGWLGFPAPVVNNPCPPVMRGDVNGDSLVDGGDIDLFVRVLLDPGAGSNAERCAADMDMSGGVENIHDLRLFIACLLTGPC